MKEEGSGLIPKKPFKIGPGGRGVEGTLTSQEEAVTEVTQGQQLISQEAALATGGESAKRNSSYRSSFLTISTLTTE